MINQRDHKKSGDMAIDNRERTTVQVRMKTTWTVKRAIARTKVEMWRTKTTARPTNSIVR